MQIKFKKQVYLYGKNFGNLMFIYVNPRIFDKVSLSSLEGYFVCNDSHLRWSDRVEALSPRISLDREQMKEFADKHNGRFIPF